MLPCSNGCVRKNFVLAFRQMKMYVLRATEHGGERSNKKGQESGRKTCKTLVRIQRETRRGRKRPRENIYPLRSLDDINRAQSIFFFPFCLCGLTVTFDIRDHRLLCFPLPLCQGSKQSSSFWSSDFVVRPEGFEADSGSTVRHRPSLNYILISLLVSSFHFLSTHFDTFRKRRLKTKSCTKLFTSYSVIRCENVRNSVSSISSSGPGRCEMTSFATSTLAVPRPKINETFVR